LDIECRIYVVKAWSRMLTLADQRSVMLWKKGFEIIPRVGVATIVEKDRFRAFLFDLENLWAGRIGSLRRNIIMT
jgi:hypothetical protein